jgi:carboxymethylenebutenolidase
MKRRNLLLASSASISSIFAGAHANTKTAASIPQGKTVHLDIGLSGYYVKPKGSGLFPPIIVMMEAFGLNNYIKSVCDRLVSSGYAVLAPDFYHGALFPYTDLKGAVAKLKTIQDSVVMAEFGKGMEFLSGQSDLKKEGVGVLGFCMGGRFAFLANAVHANKVKATIAFYGGGIAAMPDPLGRASLLNQINKMNAPIMLMYGAEDQSITAAEHQRISLALSQAKKRYSLNVFPNSRHGFFSDRRDSYNADASAEAWAMSLNFFDHYLAGKAA